MSAGQTYLTVCVITSFIHDQTAQSAPVTYDAPTSFIPGSLFFSIYNVVLG